MPEWWGENAIKDEVEKYFPRCPFCLEKTVQPHRDNWNAQDTAKCSSCGAEWHLYHNMLTEKMQWAELKKAGIKGGEDLVGAKYKPEFWRKVFLKNLKQRGKPEKKSSEETVAPENSKEKEVASARCPHCGKLYDENLSTCPHCGSLTIKQLLKRCTAKLEDMKKRIHE